MRKHEWIIGLLLIAVSCGGESKSTSSTSTTASPTTSNPTSTSAGPTTTSTVVSGQGFEPPCVESFNASSRFEFANESALDTFGPLSATPSLQVTLPLGRSLNGDGLVQPFVIAARIPGGVLLAAKRGSVGDFEGSLLTAIDADGTTRWVRCFNEGVIQVFAAPASTEPTRALISLELQRVDDWPIVEWQTVDLNSGATAQSMTELLEGTEIGAEGLGAWALAESPSRVVLGPPAATVVNLAQHHLTLIDLGTMSATSIPFPEESAGRDLYQFPIGFAFSPVGDLLLGEHDQQRLWTPTIAYTDDAWTEVLPEGSIEPVRIGVVVDDPGVNQPGNEWLSGYDPDGTQLWRRDDIALARIEGFVYRLSGPVTLMVGCPPDDCDISQGGNPYRLYGIDSATGARLWDNEFIGVLVVGDGFALVTGGDNTRIMIDTATGELVDASQQWTPNSYYQGCCGDDGNWVGRYGGVVVAASGERVDVWYPIDVAPETHAVTIP